MSAGTGWGEDEAYDGFQDDSGSAHDDLTPEDLLCGAWKPVEEPELLTIPEQPAQDNQPERRLFATASDISLKETKHFDTERINEMPLFTRRLF